MIVIADTSPINYLIQIGAVDVLPKLYDQIIIPEGVRRELNVSAAPPKVRDWFGQIPDWLVVRALETPINPELAESLDAGESEAIQIASELNADLLMIDERLGRKIAIKRGLKVIGTIGILVQAKRVGLVDLDLAISDLIETNFYISPELREYLREQ
jgi:predicted nucleic acid-binding protein